MCAGGSAWKVTCTTLLMWGGSRRLQRSSSVIETSSSSLSSTPHSSTRLGRGGLTYNSTRLSCLDTGTQTHTQHTLIPTHRLQNAHPISHTRIFIFILYYFVIYMNTYINTVCLWLREQRVKLPRWRKSYISLLQSLFEHLTGWNSTATVLIKFLLWENFARLQLQYKSSIVGLQKSKKKKALWSKFQ